MDEVTAAGSGAACRSESATASLSAPGRHAIRAARHRRASIVRRRKSGAGMAPASTARPGTSRLASGYPAAGALTPIERDLRRASVADALVRTIRSVPMPGVPPFSRRDRLLIVGLVAVEALVAVLLGAAARR